MRKNYADKKPLTLILVLTFQVTLQPIPEDNFDLHITKLHVFVLCYEMQCNMNSHMSK